MMRTRWIGVSDTHVTVYADNSSVAFSNPFVEAEGTEHRGNKI